VKEATVNSELGLRSGVRLLSRLLLQGQRVDWRYSLVVILVITGLFSTPLVLGSIRNRVYAALKTQIEKENNAREISLQLREETAAPLTRERVAQLLQDHPDAEAVGNYKLVVSVEGPERSDLPTLHTLEPGDPRTAPLAIEPGVPETFGLTDLIVSDALGQLLFLPPSRKESAEERKRETEEAWNGLWADGKFQGPPLRLRINDIPLAPEFRLVARRRLPGRGLYGSTALGIALKRYARGLGAPELGLPADEGLLQAALPKLATTRCLLFLTEDSCPPSELAKLARRLEELHFPTATSTAWPPRLGSTLGVSLTEVVNEGGVPVTRPLRANCSELLAPALSTACPEVPVFSDLTVDVGLEVAAGERHSVPLRASLPELRSRLAASTSPRPPAGGGVLDLTVPRTLGLAAGTDVTVRVVSGAAVPARVQSLYDCAAADCPTFADELVAFRLANLAEGAVTVASLEPVTYVPAPRDEEFDEILLYPRSVEEVERVAGALRDHALYEGYNVAYNAAAIDKLMRQDSRLKTLFGLTMALSALFLGLALGSLAQINLERRRRQMAQLLILGFARRFVRRLVLAEALALTVFASVAAAGLTSLLCGAARVFLAGRGGDGSNRGDFDVVLKAMVIDPAAFALVFGVVVLCTTVIAFFAARRAAQADPLTLLD
jgi:hypothetical protein